MAEPDENGREASGDDEAALSSFRFIDLESAAPIHPSSVRMDGLELAGFVQQGGKLEVILPAGEHVIEVVADGYEPMSARHGAVAPKSLPNVFHLTPFLNSRKSPAQAAGMHRLFGWVREKESYTGVPDAQITLANETEIFSTSSDLTGAYSLSVPSKAFESNWMLKAVAANGQTVELSGRGRTELPQQIPHTFILPSGTMPARQLNSSSLAFVPRELLAWPAPAREGQQPPSTIRVGMGRALSAAQGCTGMNAKCSSSMNACTEVEVVDMEVYVKRVFRGELYATLIWNDAQKECFKANAVAIRSYAAWHALSGPRGAQYDICNGDNCQCYFSGFSAFGPVSTAASQETAGQVLFDANGRIARAEYGSWNGPCPRGIMHCDFLPIYDYAIDQNWDLRPAQSSLWGHGRGQSQYGSHFRARNGESYRQILGFYYGDYQWQLSNLAPPEMTSPGWTGNQFRFAVRAAANSTLVLQTSSDLTNWASLSTNVVGAGGTVEFQDNNTPFGRRFYRAMQLLTNE